MIESTKQENGERPTTPVGWTRARTRALPPVFPCSRSKERGQPISRCMSESASPAAAGMSTAPIRPIGSSSKFMYHVFSSHTPFAFRIDTFMAFNLGYIAVALISMRFALRVNSQYPNLKLLSFLLPDTDRSHDCPCIRCSLYRGYHPVYP